MLNFRLKRIEKSARIKWDPRSRGREPARMWRLGRNARESYRGWWGPRPWPVSTTTTTRDTRGLDGQCAACRRWWAVCSYMPQWFGQCAAVWHVGDCGQCVRHSQARHQPAAAPRDSCTLRRLLGQRQYFFACRNKLPHFAFAQMTCWHMFSHLGCFACFLGLWTPV